MDTGTACISESDKGKGELSLEPRQDECRDSALQSGPPDTGYRFRVNDARKSG